jgi:hypothetical protein
MATSTDNSQLFAAYSIFEHRSLQLSRLNFDRILTNNHSEFADIFRLSIFKDLSTIFNKHIDRIIILTHSKSILDASETVFRPFGGERNNVLRLLGWNLLAHNLARRNLAQL